MLRLLIAASVAFFLTGCSNNTSQIPTNSNQSNAITSQSTLLPPPTLSELDRIFPREIQSKEDEAECLRLANTKVDLLNQHSTNLARYRAYRERGYVKIDYDKGWAKFYPDGKQAVLTFNDGTFNLNIFDPAYETSILHIMLMPDTITASNSSGSVMLSKLRTGNKFERVDDWNIASPDRIEALALEIHEEVFK